MMKNSKEQKTALPELRFPEFRDSEGWTQKIVSNVLDNQSSSLALNKLKFTEVGYPVYGADSDKIIGLISYYTQNEDYISIVKDGSGVGRLALRQKQTSVLGTLNCLTSTEKRRYILSWLYYMMQTIDLTNYVKGSGIPHIYYADYKKHTIFIPTPREQTKIAECFSSLDDLISAATDKIEALKEHKEGLMQQLFPADGKITPTIRFPEFHNAGEWRETTLGYLCNSIASGKNKNNIGGYYDLYGSTGIIGKTDSGDYCGTYILVARVGANAGFLTKVDGVFGVTDNTLVINLKSGISIDYIYYLLNNWGLNNLIFGSGQPLITGSQLKNLEITVPSPLEQQKIANCFSSIDKLISAETDKLDQLKAHKKGLMQRLFPKL